MADAPNTSLQAAIVQVAQDSRTDSGDTSGARAISPRLLKRIAEAALGDIGNKNRWWVASFQPVADDEYDIDGFPTRKEAEDYWKGRNSHGIFGPYERDKSDPGVVVQEHRVQRLSIEVIGEGKVPLDGSQFDALFWGIPALEKFVLPYYTSASGLDYALKVREKYISKQAYMLAHSGDTEHKIFSVEKTEPNKFTVAPIL